MNRSETSLKEATLLWQKKYLLIGIVIIAAIITYGVSSLLPKSYNAHAEILLQSLQNPATGYNVTPQPLTPTQIATDIELFGSSELKTSVKHSLGFLPSVTISQIGQTSALDVSATARNPYLASKIANTYAKAFVNLLNQQQSQQINQVISTVNQAIQSLSAQQQNIVQQLSQLGNSSSDNAQKQSLEQKLELINSQLLLLNQQLSSLEVEQQTAGSNAQIIVSATPPSSPSFPQPLKFSLISALAALIIAILTLLFIDKLDQTIKTKHTLEQLSGDLPVLGIIPVIPNWKSKQNPRAITFYNSSSPSAESYRALRTAIQFTALNRKIKSLEITSPNGNEGKSITCANLGVAMAESGLKVILVGADLRFPKLHEYFGFNNDKGLTSILLGDVSIEATLSKAVTATGQLYVLPAGPKPPNPAELLASDKMRELLTQLESLCDLLIFDAPPVLPVTDASIISKLVDATIVIVMANSTTKGQLSRSLEILEQVEAPVIGTVLNAAVPGAEYGYSYSYNSLYYNNQPKHDRQTKLRS